MIREIINYTKHLKENSYWVFKQNLKPTKGLHIFIEFDENGNVINFPGEKGKNWDYYDGKEMSEFLKKIIPFEQSIQRIGTSMNKVFDKKKQLISCSPYAISFKKGKLEEFTNFTKINFVNELKKINDISSKCYNKLYQLFNNEIENKNEKDKIKINGYAKIYLLLPFYFDKSLEECFDELDDLQRKKILQFQNFILEHLDKIEDLDILNTMKKDNLITIYLKNSLEEYQKAHRNYLKRNLFNKNDFNSDKEISDDTFGLSGFYNGLNAKKIFLEHKTASMYRGIASRIKAKDAVILNDFDTLLKRKIFPTPLPIFIDEREFYTTDEIIKIFKENEKMSYSQILKKLFDENENIFLENYYLLFFNYKYELEDFDFVSKFRYSLKQNGQYPEIINLFCLKKNNELQSNKKIKNIFQFETEIVRKIFNNSLVKIDEKNGSFTVNYFGEIKPEYVSGGDLIYQMILKYRKAFYDYIYKSQIKAINSLIWDEIMWNTIIADLRNDKIDNGYHSKDYSIKEKLNIWFSLYNYFVNNKRRYDMASKIPQLLGKMREVANDDSKHFETPEEFAFGAGQVIYYLLNQSKASEKTHALLEPFLQKVQAELLQDSIAKTINTYKHELSFGQGRFERLSAEVLGYDTKENLKKYQRFLLAGYFATPVIYEKKEKTKEEVANG